jgi:DNA invertase Pin-like site-specific DNA recombinase
MDALTRAKCARIYQEKASGAKTERPELMKLLDTARKGDVVIVWKLDRLARSLRQLIDTTVLLNEHGVELHSVAIQESYHFEGFFCDPSTEVFWSVPV